MKKQLLLSLVLAGSVVASSAFAADEQQSQSSNTSSLKMNEVQKKDEKVKDIDDEITNARLRTQLGSKSRWSFKSALGYSGGSVEAPFDTTRPAYRAGGSREALTSIDGTVGINFRLTERDNLGLNTGISITDPLHGDITKPAVDPRRGNVETPRYQVSTPTASWSRGYKAFGMQNVSEVGLSLYTDEDSDLTNAKGSVSVSQTVLGNFGNSNWSGGVAATLGKEIYGGDIKFTDAETVDAFRNGTYKRADLVVALYPFAEYTFNDTYSFRTVFGYFEFYRYMNEYQNGQDFEQKEPYQSAGIGISVTRDIYVYPNIQFTPKDIRADRTNVALSTNINLF